MDDEKVQTADNLTNAEALWLVRKRTETGLTARQDWIQEAQQGFRYPEGFQWPSDTAEDTTRIHLTLNRMGPALKRIYGFLVEARPVMDLGPREDSDEQQCRILRAEYEWTIDRDQTHFKIARCVHNYLRAMGVLKEYFDPELGERGEIASASVNPEEIILDPDFRSQDMNDLEWLIHIQRWTLDEARKAFPKHAKQILEDNIYHDKIEHDTTGLDSEHTGSTPEITPGSEDYSNVAEGEDLGSRFDKTVTVKEMWYKRRFSPKSVFNRRTGQPEEIPAEDVAEDSRDLMVGERTVVETWVATVVGDNVLIDNRPSPYEHNRIPFAIFFGEPQQGSAYPRAEAFHLFSLQEMYNKLHSLAIDNAVRTANALWTAPKGALDPEDKQNLQTFGSSPGVLVEYNAQYGKLERIAPAPLSAPIVELSNRLHMTFDDLTSIRDVNRGDMPYETSGKGIIALTRQAAKGLMHHQIAVENALSYWAHLRLANIQQYHDYPKKIRITDEIGEEQEVVINEERQEEGQRVKHNDLSVIKYDIRMQLGSGYERDKKELAEIAVALADRGAIDGQALLDALDFPKRKEIQERMNQKNMALAVGQQIVENPGLSQVVQVLSQDPNLLAQVLQGLQTLAQQQQGAVPQPAPQPGPALGGRPAPMPRTPPEQA